MTTKPTLFDVYPSILDSLNPNDLKTVVSRMKTSSKSFKNTILGDDNLNRMLSGNYFKYNGKYIISDSIILKNNKAEKVTFNGMTLNEIMDIILNEGYLLYFSNQKKRTLYKATVLFKNGIFYFNCTNMFDPKYNSGDWFAYCTYTLEFKHLKPEFKLIKTLPHIGKTETLYDIIKTESDVDERRLNAMSEAVYYQDLPYDLQMYINKEEEVSKPNFEFIFENDEKEDVKITVIFKQK